VPLVGEDHACSAQKVIDLAGDAANGRARPWSASRPISRLPAVQEFKTKFNAKFKYVAGPQRHQGLHPASMRVALRDQEARQVRPQGAGQVRCTA